MKDLSKEIHVLEMQIAHARLAFPAKDFNEITKDLRERKKELEKEQTFQNNLNKYKNFING